MKKTSGSKIGKNEPAAPALPNPQPARTQSAFPIAGIGASAGGLEALELFLKHVPEGSGMAFVVQHLDPTYKGMMVDLLQRTTRMPVAGQGPPDGRSRPRLCNPAQQGSPGLAS